MVETGYVVVLITAGSYEEARRVADVLVGERKAACVNIVPRVNSFFWWEGKIEEDEESLLVVKTRAELFAEVVDSVKANHSYEVPEIIALPIVGGNQEYLMWIGEETSVK
ncbi:MAG: divalent-cation tolerance protein CutA [Thermodesulfobacteriota bacterium]|nr:divalent-cation tolerance protein CutA [Thermodesulfobacteriota bacterium]